MKDPFWNICIECADGGRMVCDRDGDYVCACCGLVKADRCIDDAMDFLMAEQCAPLLDEKAEKRDVELDGALFGLDESLVGECYELYKATKSAGNHRNKKDVMAACLYVASKKNKRGIGIQEAMRRFGVDKERDIWCIVREIEGAASVGVDVEGGVADPQINRMVHSLGLGQEAWEVIRVAQDLASRARERHICQGMRGLTRNACLVYISLMACGAGLGMKEVSRVLGVSMSTMKKQESVIREGLASASEPCAAQA